MERGWLDPTTKLMLDKMDPEAVSEVMTKMTSPWEGSPGTRRYVGLNPNPDVVIPTSDTMKLQEAIALRDQYAPDTETYRYWDRQIQNLTAPPKSMVEVNTGNDGPRYEVGSIPQGFVQMYDEQGRPTEQVLQPGSPGAMEIVSDATAQMNEAGSLLEVIDIMMEHEGLGAVTGMGGRAARALPGGVMPGVTDFLSYEDQLKGKLFMQAYQTLKGGGQITEVEGKKATEAMARLNRPGLSEEDYRKALTELREVIDAGYQRARQRARRYSGEPAGEAPPRRWNPDKGVVE